MTLQQDIAAITRRLNSIETYLPRIRLREIPTSRIEVAMIVGGQTVVGYPMIQYVDDLSFTPDKFYDPAKDTTYIPGLGNAILYNYRGQSTGQYILVRHNFQADTDALIVGIPRVIVGTVRLPVTSGDDKGRVMLAYTIGFPAI